MSQHEKSNNEQTGIDNPFFEATLIKAIKERVHQNHSLPRRETTSYRINPETADKFYRVCHDLDLAGYHRGVNQVLEAFMNIMIELYDSKPKQVTLNMYKSTINKNTLFKIDNLTVTDKMELKLVKEDLTNLLAGFDTPDPSKDYIRHLNQNLKKVLPKAIQWKHMTQDPELNELLVKSEKYLK